MELKNILINSNPNLVIFLLTSLFAVISWMIKGLIEKPLIESKNTFNRFLEKRVEILTEIKTRLNLIAYFPNGENSDEFKEQLQGLLLKDGKAGYLNKSTYECVMKISIDPVTDEKLLLDTLKEIDTDLYNQISKIEDEIRFYHKFSHFNPFKRFIGFTLLGFQYALSLLFILGLISALLYGFSFLF